MAEQNDSSYPIRAPRSTTDQTLTAYDSNGTCRIEVDALLNKALAENQQLLIPCSEACDGSRSTFTIPTTYSSKNVNVNGSVVVIVSDMPQHPANAEYDPTTRTITLNGRWVGNMPVADDYVAAMFVGSLT